MSALQKKESYSFEDWSSWDEDMRAEIIDGTLYMMAQPTQRHQEIVGEIYRQIANYLVGKRCKVFPGNFGVNLFPSTDKRKRNKKDTILVPDITVVCDLSKLDGKVCNGPPDMVVEVLSPSTAQADRLIKLKQYLQAGVQEYWIVDPECEMVNVHILQNENYSVIPYGKEDTITVNVLEGCEVELRSVYG